MSTNTATGTNVTVDSLVLDATVVEAVATLTAAATRTVRKVGDTLRFKTEMPSIVARSGVQAHAAIWTLVAAGARVRVFEGQSIWTPALTHDGLHAWNTRASRLDRTKSGAVVEVVL